MFTLPAGHRPHSNIIKQVFIFHGNAPHGQAVGELIIYTDGRVTIQPITQIANLNYRVVTFDITYHSW